MKENTKKWALWIGGGLLAVVILVLAVSGIALATFNPNAYKDQVAAAVKEKTGRDLTIAGDIGVTYFPVLGFEVQGVQLSNPPGFTEKTFISAGKVSAGVKLASIFTRDIELTDIILDEPHINIIKQSDGASNLQLARTNEQAADADSGPARNISIKSIKISNASVTYTDMVAGKSFAVDPLNMTIPGFRKGEDIDFSTDMVVKRDGSAEGMPVNIKSSINADPEAGVYQFTDLKGDITFNRGEGTESTKVSFSGTASTDVRAEEIVVSDLTANWGMNADAKGSMTIKNFAEPAISFALVLSTLDLNAFAPAEGTPMDVGRELLPVRSLQGMNLDGTVTIAEMKVAKLTATNVEASIKGNNGLITIDPLRANVYQGVREDRLVIDARTDIPNFNLTGSVSNVQAGEFLAAVLGSDYVTGQFSARYTLMAAGNTVRALRETAGGTVNASLAEGTINKWQLSRLLNQAVTFFETGNVNPGASDNFRFTSVKASLNGSNGIFRNEDLTIIAPGSHALGSGTIRLDEQTVDYSLNVGLGEDPQTFAGARHVPIRITGPLTAPGYALDFQAIATQAIEEQLQDRIEEQMGPFREEPAAGEEKQDFSPSGIFDGLLKRQ